MGLASASMFGRHEILKDGEGAEAIVLGVAAGRISYTNSKGEDRWHLHLRVRFADGTIEDTTATAYAIGPAGYFGVGEVLPVKYLPDDRTTVEVDRDAIVAAKEAGREEAQEGLVKLAEERLARGEE